MTDHADSVLRSRLQRAISPSVPVESASERVLRRLRTAVEAGSGSAWRPRLPQSFAAVLVGAVVVALLGGALGAALAVRRGQPSNPSVPAPASRHTPTALLSPTASPAPALSMCAGTSLSASISGSLGAAGHDGFDVKLHNQGAGACTLTGYASLSGKSGAQPVPLNVQHEAAGMLINPTGPGGAVPVQTVVLAPGGDAYFTAEYVTVNSDPRPCATLTALVVTPPGVQSELVVDATPAIGAVCAVDGGNPWINETPVAATPYLRYEPRS